MTEPDAAMLAVFRANTEDPAFCDRFAIEGLLVLVAFLVGLFTANTLITFSAAFGFVSAARHPRVYLTLASITAVVSLTLGFLYTLGADSIIPPLLGG